jgi:pimeloyl-ACP methyl ester carboxylesterase
MGEPRRSNKTKPAQVVLLIHGIRTHAWWQGEVKGLIEEATGATVIPLKYGRFDLLRFWCPFGICRQGPIDRLHKDLRDAIHQFGGRPISAIAHSYGTYALARILLEHDDIELNRVILCGSIIANSFPWARIANQIKAREMRTAVVNDCGTRDIWPVLAASTTWGYGSSGTHGFGSVQVTDRIHAMPHSGYFDRKFVKKFWLPFIADGEIVASAVERAGTGTPGWFSLLELPYKWAVMVLAVLAIASTAWTILLSDRNWTGGTANGNAASSANQNMTINGNNNSSTQIITIPAAQDNGVQTDKKIDGAGNQAIQEKIE